MKLVLLFLLLSSGCAYILDDANYRHYELTWVCRSPEGCERAEQVELVDRVEIINGWDRIRFWSSRDNGVLDNAELVDSDALPSGCSWLYGLSLFTHELEPSRFCRTSNGLDLELSIPNRDPTTNSQWLVQGRQIAP